MRWDELYERSLSDSAASPARPHVIEFVECQQPASAVDVASEIRRADLMETTRGLFTSGRGARRHVTDSDGVVAYRAVASRVDLADAFCRTRPVIG